MNEKVFNMNENPLKQIIAKQKAGEAVGIYSACSANSYVIEAAIECAKRDNSCVLIEATANQVDQNGGYTGMKPVDFRNFVYEIAEKVGFTTDRIFLGGDHLGPLTFASKPEAEAMADARELIDADYVGFKIPNEFVVGYGLDYNQKYRNLPYIGVLKPAVYEK